MRGTDAFHFTFGGVRSQTMTKHGHEDPNLKIAIVTCSFVFLSFLLSFSRSFFSLSLYQTIATALT